MKTKAHAHSGCASNHTPLPELAARLRRQSHKVTGPRQAILDILRRRHGPVTIREIFEELGSGDGDLAPVYRSMHLLETMRMVKRFDFGDGAARFELLAEGDDGHHHHLVCTRCTNVVEIEDCFPEELQSGIARRNGFKSVTHRLEFFGVCPSCQ